MSWLRRDRHRIEAQERAIERLQAETNKQFILLRGLVEATEQVKTRQEVRVQGLAPLVGIKAPHAQDPRFQACLKAARDFLAQEYGWEQP